MKNAYKILAKPEDSKFVYHFPWGSFDFYELKPTNLLHIKLLKQLKLYILNV
jgi:hypothetical protein